MSNIVQGCFLEDPFGASAEGEMNRWVVKLCLLQTFSELMSLSIGLFLFVQIFQVWSYPAPECEGGNGFSWTQLVDPDICPECPCVGEAIPSC
jgi:hypothetical protein